MNEVVVRSLVECEEIIERGLETFYEVGAALAEIQANKDWYREQYGTFENYCAERWGLKRQRAYELIEAADIRRTSVSEFSDIAPPAIESHAAALAPLREQPEKLREAWTEAVEVTNGKPTARDVRAVVEQYRDVPAATDTSPAPPYTTCPTCGHRVRADKPLRPRKEST